MIRRNKEQKSRKALLVRSKVWVPGLVSLGGQEFEQLHDLLRSYEN